MAKTFILSDDSLNSYGFRFLTEGADLSEFIENPIMLLDHNDSTESIIGRWINTRIENGVLLADAEFDMGDSDAAKIAGKVDRGFVKCCSIGAIPIETSTEPEHMLPGQTYPTITKWKLKEVSIVSKGANKNAKIRLYDESGNLIIMSEAKELLKMKDGYKQQLNIMTKVHDLLKLKADATPTEVELAVQQIINAKTKAEADLQVLQDKETARVQVENETKKTDAVKLIDAAVADGRINASAKESYIKLFDKDFDSAKTSLEGIPSRRGVVESLNGGGGSDYEKYLKMSFGEIDKQGLGGIVKMNHPELYKQKFDAWKADLKKK